MAGEEALVYAIITDRSVLSLTSLKNIWKTKALSESKKEKFSLEKAVHIIISLVEVTR